MRKIKAVFAVLFITGLLSSCASVFGGKVTTFQKTKPLTGQPQRDVRIVPLVADVLIFWPIVIVDFATGAIYKPEKLKITNLN